MAIVLPGLKVVAEFALMCPVANKPEPTDARFSLRLLLIAMAVVALIAALVGPAVRRLPAETQFRLLVAWGLWLAVCVIWIGYQAKRRFDAERLAGQTLLRLPMFDERVGAMWPIRRGFNIAAASLLTLFALFISSAMIVNTRPGGITAQFFPFAMMSFGSIAWIYRVVAMLWWRNNIRFSTAGILWDQQVLLWDHVVDTRWDPLDPMILEVKGIDQHNLDRKWKIPVPPERRGDVQAVLDQSIVTHPSLPVGSLAYELGRIPISEAIRHPQLLRYIRSIGLGIVSFVAAFYFMRNGLTGIAEFDHSVFWGFIFSGLTASWRWRRIGKDAGCPIVRLSGWRGWQRLVPIVALAAAFYYLGNTVSWSVPGLAYVAGICFGCVVGSGITSNLRSFDLRENGVVLQGELYWPWKTVKVFKWDRDGNGRLVLSRGWHRVIATVPREQRNAVDALLANKIAG